jgi:tetratricopeptide (TPR) repeat protein
VKGKPLAVVPRLRFAAFALLALALVGSLISAHPAGPRAAPNSAPRLYRFHPGVRPAESLAGVLKQVSPGSDAFPEEKTAGELAQVLGKLRARLMARPLRPALGDWLLAPDFRGGHVVPAEEASSGSEARLGIRRARTMPEALDFDRLAFEKELATWVRDFRSIDTVELEIVAIEVTAGANPDVHTTVRFDLAGVAAAGGRVERSGHWRMRWQRGSDPHWRVREWTTVDQLRSHAAIPVFVEATNGAFGANESFRRQLVAGLDEWLTHLDASFASGGMGHHGVSAGDADGDGLDDLFVCQPAGLPDRLLRNNGDGTFTDVTTDAGLAVLDSTSQAIFADVENDGDQDLLLVTRSEPLLFVNDGKGHFTRASDAFRFAQPVRGTLTSVSVADYDRDGFLDVYLCTYAYVIGASEDKTGPPSPYHDATNGPPNVLLRNDGHGRFQEVTRDVGLDENNDRFSFAAAWADYDEDGWPDLLVANDFGRKNLYRLGLTNGAPRFTDVAAAAGVEDYGAGMSATLLDYDNDGHLDVYTGNMWTSAGLRITGEPGFKPDAPQDVRDLYHRHARGNSLFRNRGDGTFEDVTLGARAEYGRWAWSSDAFDFDNDGWQDLYIANGMFTRDAVESNDNDARGGTDVDSFFWRQVVAQSPLTRTPGTAYDDGWRATNRLLVADAGQAQHERNVLLRNDGRGGFDDVSGSSGLDVDQDGRSFATLDYDGDGDLDVVLLAPRSSPQLRLFRNDFVTGHGALALRLTGAKSNRDAIGARVTVETDRVRATRVLMAGSGFLSQHSKELLFGLGDSTRIAKVTIWWPSGHVQTLADLPMNHRIWVDEGRDPVRSEAFRPAREPKAAPPAKAERHEQDQRAAGTWLYEPVPAPSFVLHDLTGAMQPVPRTGRPSLLYFWASSAPPSREALNQLSQGAARIATAGGTVLAVAVDDPADEPKVRAAAAGLQIPVAVATRDIAGTYNVLHRYLFDRREDLLLPTTFLVNAQGAIVKVYSNALPIETVLRDLATIEATPRERLARAVPFAGTFHGPPGARTYFQYGLELSEQGFDGPALSAFERVAATDPSAITFYNLGTLYARAGRQADARAALERAVAAKPDYAEAHNTLGALLAQAGDFPSAIAHLKAALEAQPTYADAMNNLGYVLFQAGDAQQAHQLYERALQAQPEFPEALNNLGILFGQQRDLDRAESCFRRAVAQRPTYGEAANNLAIVLSARGDKDAAIALLERFVSDVPSFEPAYVTLGKLYMDAGRQQDAEQVMQRLHQLQAAGR